MSLIRCSFLLTVPLALALHAVPRALEQPSPIAGAVDQAADVPTAAVTAPALAAPAAALPIGMSAPEAPAPTEMVVFGASSADPGNAYILTGGLLPAPPYWQGRFSNGPTWVDQLASQLTLPVPGPFVTGGTNYAVAGAGAGPGFSNSCANNACAPNIGLQIEYYLASNPSIEGDELFVLQGGGNDFLSFTGLDNATIAAYHMREHIETLAAAGARRFAIINLGPDYLSPTKYLVSNNAWILRFNEMLEVHLQQLESQLGLTIARVDWYTLKSEIIANPGAFGLTNITDPACPNCGAPGSGATVVPDPEEYFLWDGVHVTTVVHTFIADIALDSITVALGL